MVSIRRRKFLLAAASSANADKIQVLVSGEEQLGVKSSRNSGLHFRKPPLQEKELKKRKLHKRKQVNNQEPCMLRGVYFKNLKWQAAIKVGKKQIHLGTVNSQEEAAHLYDRAAYMCGREPNFALTDEEKRELQALEWDEFLDFTRKEVAHKKMQNKLDAQMRRIQQS